MEGLNAFADAEGGNLAVTRMHYLNEDRLLTAADDASGEWGDNGLIGYFVADYEQAGPHSMLEEALAVANGNARFIGHLVDSADGSPLAVATSSWTLDLDPWELRAFRLTTGPVPLFSNGFDSGLAPWSRHVS